jgi:hypothetical protein
VSQAELEIGRTVIRTVRFNFTQAAVEDIVADWVKRQHGVKLKDFTLKCEIDLVDETNGVGFECHVSGEARTDGLAPTRKRKAKA